MTAALRKHWPQALIVAAFIIIASIYSVTTPIFEASDEISHYPVVQHIAETGTLPVQVRGVETLWEQEGSQPPLYYLLSAGLTFWIDTSDLEEIRWRNPHAKLGIPLDPDNRNMILHTRAEAFPWRGTVLAVHLIRFFGVLLGTGTVILTYLIARELAPDSQWAATTAAALVAFNPMFLFITGSVNNDNLTVLLSTAIMLICIRVLRDGLTKPRVLMLAVLTALVTITKISGLTLIPLVGLSLLIHAWKTREWKQAFYAGLVVIAAWVVLASWWYIRNLVTYHELLGLDTHVAIAGSRSIGFIDLIRNEWYGFWVSYWALFGAVNILADPPIYYFYAMISLMAIIGLALAIYQQWRSKRWDQLILIGFLATQITVVMIGVIRWTMTTYASQGRLVFPTIAALSTLTALGLMTLFPKRAHLGITVATVLPMIIIAAAAPFAFIKPVYAAPPTISELPSDAILINAHFDDLILVGAQITPVTVEEGERVPITLYWQAENQIQSNYSLYLHGLGRNYDEVAKIDSYPGAGALPTSLMEPGVIYVDEYSLELEPDFATPTLLHVLIGVALHHEDGTYQSIDPTHPDGSARDAVVVETGVAYAQDMQTCIRSAPANQSPISTFGGFAALWADQVSLQALPGDDISISLDWDRIGATPTNWTVFIHLLDSNGERVAQADSPPLDGFYPTSLWKRPCYVEDQHTLSIPADLAAGEYQLVVGLYDPSHPAFMRAVAADSAGTPFPDFAVPIGTVTVK